MNIMKEEKPILNEPQGSITAEEYFTFGQSHKENRSFSDAVSCFSFSIALDPANAEAYFQRGICFESLNDRQRAFEDYTKALELNPSHATAFLKRGLIHDSAGRHDEAGSDFSSAIRIDPGFADAYLNRGNFHRRNRHYDRANLDYNKAIEIEPESAGAFIDRGILHALLNRFEEALADFNKAIGITPNFAMGFYNRAVLNAKQGFYDSAIGDLNKAVYLNPFLSVAYTLRSLLYQKSGLPAKGSAMEYKLLEHLKKEVDIRSQLQISREKAIDLANETISILDNGFYLTETGDRIDISARVKQSVNETVSYPPETVLPEKTTQSGSTVVEIRNETTLRAVEYIKLVFCSDAVVLNLASATSPGGGFLRGARAQEEYLARSTALWACLKDNDMYSFHREQKDPFYSDFVIYSPDVLVIRDDDGRLLEQPDDCSIITSPAVQANGVRRYFPKRVDEIAPVMWKRILKVLAVAERHNHRNLVLGAWGCGAFGNDGAIISGLFKKALKENFRGAFNHVVFAIADWSEDEKFIGPFKDTFGGSFSCFD